MYGNAAMQQDVSSAPACDTLGNINEETMNGLSNSREIIDSVLRRVRGSQPEAKDTLAKVQERSIIGDAKEMRNLARELTAKLSELSALLS